MYFYFQLKDLIKTNEDLEYRLKKDNEKIYRKFRNVLYQDPISAKELIDILFSQDNSFDMFISHSHSDRTKAIALANELYKEYGFKSFIDSEFWQHKDKLLKEFDNLYCKNKNENTYDYTKRNVSTTHTNIMLSYALREMMYRCKCIIFINTKNSVNLSEGIEEPSTYSPWIFQELTTLETMRIKDRPHSIELKSISESSEKVFNAQDSMPKVNYSAPFIDEIPQITLRDIKRIFDENNNLFDLCQYIEKDQNISFEDNKDNSIRR